MPSTSKALRVTHVRPTSKASEDYLSVSLLVVGGQSKCVCCSSLLHSLAFAFLSFYQYSSYILTIPNFCTQYPTSFPSASHPLTTCSKLLLTSAYDSITIYLALQILSFFVVITASDLGPVRQGIPFA